MVSFRGTPEARRQVTQQAAGGGWETSGRAYGLSAVSLDDPELPLGLSLCPRDPSGVAQ
jgi:hypothetical protein